MTVCKYRDIHTTTLYYYAWCVNEGRRTHNISCVGIGKRRHINTAAEPQNEIQSQSANRLLQSRIHLERTSDPNFLSIDPQSGCFEHINIALLLSFRNGDLDAPDPNSLANCDQAARM